MSVNDLSFVIQLENPAKNIMNFSAFNASCFTVVDSIVRL